MHAVFENKQKTEPMRIFWKVAMTDLVHAKVYCFFAKMADEKNK